MASRPHTVQTWALCRALLPSHATVSNKAKSLISEFSISKKRGETVFHVIFHQSHGKI